MARASVIHFLFSIYHNNRIAYIFVQFLHLFRVSLIPRGAPESENGGFACQLFAMISNYDDDHVEQDLTGTCGNASAYCGIRDRLYPDKRNMGFPFDRVAKKNDGELIDFLLPNMTAVDCKIIFNDAIMERTTKPHQNEQN